MEKILKIFVSPTLDVAPMMDQVYRHINKIGAKPIGMESIDSGKNSFPSDLKDAIEDSDIFLLIVGDGEEASERGNSFRPSLELQYAIELRKEIIACVKTADATILGNDKSAIYLNEIRDLVMKTGRRSIFSYWSTIWNLEGRLTKDLGGRIIESTVKNEFNYPHYLKQGNVPLRLLVDPGTASPEFIADILSDISMLYKIEGGSGIEFRLKNVEALEGAWE